MTVCNGCGHELAAEMFTPLVDGEQYMGVVEGPICRSCQLKPKRCSKCGMIKPGTSEFFYARRGRYGVGGVCKACAALRAAAYHQEHRPHRLATMQVWQRTRREKIV